MNGLLVPALLGFSAASEWFRDSIKTSSSSGDDLRRPHTRQATRARPPSKMAPPTPTTVPMTIFLSLSLKPEFSDPPSSLSLGPLTVVLVDTATTVVLVSTCDRVLLPLVVTMVVTTS